MAIMLGLFCFVLIVVFDLWLRLFALWFSESFVLPDVFCVFYFGFGVGFDFWLWFGF